MLLSLSSEMSLRFLHNIRQKTFFFCYWLGDKKYSACMYFQRLNSIIRLFFYIFTPSYPSIPLLEYNHGTHSYLAAIQLFALGSDKLEQMKKLYVITALSKCSTGGTHSLQHARTRKGYTVTWCSELFLSALM